jgi:hypothetical protein
MFNYYPIIKQEYKFIIFLDWSKKVTFKINKILLGFLISFSYSQVEWVNSEGEKSYIFIKEQYDSLLTKSVFFQNQLKVKEDAINQLQKELQVYKNTNIKNNSSNYIIEQSIPIKPENHWVWLSIGIIGGFTTCHLLNL